ncbi:MAG: hypothetical protein WC464_05095 [Bdellovibrionales bacterium]
MTPDKKKLYSKYLKSLGELRAYLSDLTNSSHPDADKQSQLNFVAMKDFLEFLEADETKEDAEEFCQIVKDPSSDEHKELDSAYSGKESIVLFASFLDFLKTEEAKPLKASVYNFADNGVSGKPETLFMKAGNEIVKRLPELALGFGVGMASRWFIGAAAVSVLGVAAPAVVVAVGGGLISGAAMALIRGHKEILAQKTTKEKIYKILKLSASGGLFGGVGGFLGYEVMNMYAKPIAEFLAAMDSSSGGSDAVEKIVNNPTSGSSGSSSGSTVCTSNCVSYGSAPVQEAFNNDYSYLRVNDCYDSCYCGNGSSYVYTQAVNPCHSSTIVTHYPNGGIKITLSGSDWDCYDGNRGYFNGGCGCDYDHPTRWGNNWDRVQNWFHQHSDGWDGHYSSGCSSSNCLNYVTSYNDCSSHFGGSSCHNNWTISDCNSRYSCLPVMYVESPASAAEFRGGPYRFAAIFNPPKPIVYVHN